MLTINNISRITEFAETEMLLSVDRFPARSVDRTGRQSVSASASNDRGLWMFLVYQPEMAADLINVVVIINFLIGAL